MNTEDYNDNLFIRLNLKPLHYHNLIKLIVNIFKFILSDKQFDLPTFALARLQKADMT